jgi:hypothetical protein
MKQRVWVIAGNVHQYNEYIRNKPLNGDKKYSYVAGVHVLKGYSNPHGVFIGSWKHRNDIIEILEQLIVSTSDNTDKLQKIRTDLIKNATKEAAIQSASDMLAKAIDQEVLDQLVGKPKVVQTVFDIMEEFDTPMTWKGFVK